MSKAPIKAASSNSLATSINDLHKAFDNFSSLLGRTTEAYYEAIAGGYSVLCDIDFDPGALIAYVPIEGPHGRRVFEIKKSPKNREKEAALGLAKICLGHNEKKVYPIADVWTTARSAGQTPSSIKGWIKANGGVDQIIRRPLIAGSDAPKEDGDLEFRHGRKVVDSAKAVETEFEVEASGTSTDGYAVALVRVVQGKLTMLGVLEPSKDGKLDDFVAGLVNRLGTETLRLREIKASGSNAVQPANGGQGENDPLDQIVEAIIEEVKNDANNKT
jgi:hypothetical protein